MRHQPNALLLVAGSIRVIWGLFILMAMFSGENISSIEVEDVLHKHPAVANVAVVAMPHEKWGETPCAFIEIIDGKNASRQNLAGFKVPSEFRFESIPKTSTGKIQKYALRQRIAAGGDSD